MSEAELAARPEWMDDDLLKTCVLNSKNLPKDTDLQIDHVDTTYAVPKGENYMSIIYRVKVDSHVVKEDQQNIVVNGSGGQKTSLIVKIEHDMQVMKDFSKDLSIFGKEIDMYENMLPKFDQHLEAAGLEPINTCRCLYSKLGDRDMLVLEDLMVEGFVSENRMKGLDLNQSKLVLEQLAKFHSSSMLHFNQNEVPARYMKIPFEPKKDMPGYEEMEKSWVDSQHKRLAELIKDLSPDPKYDEAVKFFKWYDKIDNEMGRQIWRVIPGNKFNGLVHGDCWTNNMLFKYGQNQEVEKVTLIDHQLGFYSSVLNDFIYFFFSSVNIATRIKHFAALKKFYLDCLVRNLTKLGYTGDIPTEEDFNVEFNRLRLIVAFVITMFNSIILAEMSDKQKDRSESEAFSINDMLEISSSQGKAKTFQKVLMASVDVLTEVEGFFDV